MSKLNQTIKNLSDHQLITFSSVKTIASEFGLSVEAVEYAAVEIDIFPMRYRRNRQTISASQQLKLLEAHIAIVGCGGLGGHIAEILTRIGIGKLTLVDHDVFEEHNLNRQNFSSFSNIGEPKVDVVKHSLERINPTIEINAVQKKLNPLEDFGILDSTDVIVDALDSPQTKLELAKMCIEHNIPFVHGAVAGTSGQLSVGSDLKHLYHDGKNGSEDKAGNLSYTVTQVASIQSSEVVKQILGIGESLDGQTLMIDLLYNDFTLLPA